MIPYILHTSLLVTACYVFYKVLLERETFFQINRWLLAACIALAFLLPRFTIPEEWSLWNGVSFSLQADSPAVQQSGSPAILQSDSPAGLQSSNPQILKSCPPTPMAWWHAHPPRLLRGTRLLKSSNLPIRPSPKYR